MGDSVGSEYSKSSKVDLVVLIKGTWTKNDASSWTHKDSEFCKKMDVSGFKSIESPDTYFGNNAQQRSDAAAMIANYTNEKDSDINILFVAHSHGGNALLKAIPQIKPRRGTMRIVSLSTPFIKVFFNKSYIDKVILAASFFFIMMFLSTTQWKISDGYRSFGILISLIFIAILIADFFAGPGLYGNKGLSGRAKQAAQIVNYPPVPHDIKMLVMRGVGDEAAAAIGSASTVSVLYRLSLILLSRYSGISICFVFVLAFALIAFSSTNFMEFIVGGTMVGIGLLMLCTAIVNVLAVIPVLANAGFAFDFARGLSECEFDVSTVPDGENFSVLTLGPVIKQGYSSSNEFRHKIYNHPDCAKSISDWIDNQ